MDLSKFCNFERNISSMKNENIPVRKVFSDFSDDTILTETDIYRKPNKKDLKDVEHILNDFYISNVEIPNFSTVVELQRWLRDIVINSLSKGE